MAGFQLPTIYDSDFEVPGKKPVELPADHDSGDFRQGLVISALFQNSLRSGLPDRPDHTFRSSYTGEEFDAEGAIADATTNTGIEVDSAPTSFPLTAVFGFRVNGTTASDSHALWMLSSLNVGGSGRLYLRWAKSGTLELLESQVALLASHTVDLDDGIFHHGAVLAYSATKFEVFLDGDFVIDVPNYAAAVNSPSEFRTLGSEGPSFEHGNLTFPYHHEYDRVLTHAEARLHTSDPYPQLFKPASPSIHSVETVAADEPEYVEIQPQRIVRHSGRYR